MANRERTQSASVSSAESYENKLFDIFQNPTERNEVIFDMIEVINTHYKKKKLTFWL